LPTGGWQLRRSGKPAADMPLGGHYFDACDYPQHTLLHGTPEQVRIKVREQLRHDATHPGYVFAFDHNVQHDVPPENVLATVDKAKRYPLPEDIRVGHT